MHLIVLFMGIIMAAMVFGGMLVAGIMLWEDKWSLPFTHARELKRESLKKEKLEIQIEAERARIELDWMQDVRLKLANGEQIIHPLQLPAGLSQQKRRSEPYRGEIV